MLITEIPTIPEIWFDLTHVGKTKNVSIPDRILTVGVVCIPGSRFLQ